MEQNITLPIVFHGWDYLKNSVPDNISMNIIPVCIAVVHILTLVAAKLSSYKYRDVIYLYCCYNYVLTMIIINKQFETNQFLEQNLISLMRILEPLIYYLMSKQMELFNNNNEDANSHIINNSLTLITYGLITYLVIYVGFLIGPLMLLICKEYELLGSNITPLLFNMDMSELTSSFVINDTKFRVFHIVLSTYYIIRLNSNKFTLAFSIALFVNNIEFVTNSSVDSIIGTIIPCVFVALTLFKHLLFTD